MTDTGRAHAIASCPTPVYHETHRYCPNCPWTEADDAGPCPSRLNHGIGSQSVTWKCELYEGHHGAHRRSFADVPKARIEWES